MKIIMWQQPKYGIFFSLRVNQAQKVASVMKKVIQIYGKNKHIFSKNNDQY